MSGLLRGFLLLVLGGVLLGWPGWRLAPANLAAAAVYTIIEDNRDQLTILVTGAGSTVTLPQILAGLGAANDDYLVDRGDGRWQLNSNLLIGEDVTLVLSPQAGVSDLRLRSESNGNGVAQPLTLPLGDEAETVATPQDASASINYSSFAYIRTLDGNLTIEGVQIYSWDPAAGKVDENYSNGRAYILARGRATMRIRNADLGYLGSSDGESYGLAWRDINDPEDPDTLRTRVTGELIDSQIHHNYYGIYTYQARDMVFRGNVFHHNIRYGFDPHDYTFNVIVEDNIAHNNGAHGFIISRGCHDFVFRNNVSYDNFDLTSNQAHGFMLDPGGADAGKPQHATYNTLLENNTAYGNEGFGIRILGSISNTIRNNYFYDNYAGVSIDLNSTNNIVQNNRLNDNQLYGVWLRSKADGNQILDNEINGNGIYGIYIRSDGHLIQGNRIGRNIQSGIAFLPDTTSVVQNNRVISNTVTQNGGSGIDVRDALTNEVRGNAIISNTLHGLYLDAGAQQNRFVHNSIHSNGGLGILANGSQTMGNRWSQNSLYANTGGGIALQGGANGEVGPPSLLSATGDTVQGSALSGAQVEIFADSASQGQFYVGRTTAAGGSFSFTNAQPWPGTNLVAVQIDGSGNASPFSAPIPAPDAVTPTPTNTPTNTPTATPTIPTATPTATATATASPTATVTPLVPPTATATNTATPTATTTATATASASPTDAETPKATRSVTPTITPRPNASLTPEPTPGGQAYMPFIQR